METPIPEISTADLLEHVAGKSARSLASETLLSLFEWKETDSGGETLLCVAEHSAHPIKAGRVTSPGQREEPPLLSRQRWAGGMTGRREQRIEKVRRQLVAARMLWGRAQQDYLQQKGSLLSSPQDVRRFLVDRLATVDHEVFECLWLDAQHHLLQVDTLFRGTLTQTTVYPREVVKRALKVNAAALIVVHNHPSGVPQPSEADRQLTRHLKQALGLVDVKLLDHLIVGGSETTSMAEQGGI